MGYRENLGLVLVLLVWGSQSDVTPFHSDINFSVVINSTVNLLNFLFYCKRISYLPSKFAPVVLNRCKF